MTSHSTSRRFLPRFLVLACLVLGAAVALRAAPVNYPADKSGITFDLPEGWTSDDAGKGNLRCASADGELSIFITQTTCTAAEVKGRLKALADRMASDNAYTDLESPRFADLTTPGGMHLSRCALRAKKNEEIVGSIAVSVLVGGSGNKCVLILCTASEAALQAHKELDSLFEKIRPAK